MIENKKLNYTVSLKEMDRAGAFVSFSYRVTLNGRELETGVVRGSDHTDTIDSILRRFTSTREKHS